MPAAGRPPALVDVARLAGVSLTTASRALNPDSTHPISASARQRVTAAAAQLAYQPNTMARALRTRRMPTIAVLVHDVADPYFAEVIRAISASASEEGLLTFVCNTERDPATELRYLAMLRLSRVAAVLFAGGGLEDAAYRRAVDEHAAGIAAYGGAVVALAPRSQRWAAEVADNHGGAALAAEHVVRLGHRRVALVMGPERLRTSREREAGYRSVLEAAGIEPVVVAGDYTREGGAAAAAELLELGREVTAVLVSNDNMAIGVLAALRERGVSVPADVSVVGFDDVPGLEFIHPALTTVRVPMAAIGSAGVARALAILRGSDRNRRLRVHPVELVERASSAPPLRTATGSGALG
ncbi:MAG TPA: LacI family DNA-binding transcriptional regulator [Candidatus Dormibacteraeota bacterium]